MQAAILAQRIKQAANGTKEIYDIQRSHKSMLAASDISSLTDADFLPYGMTKAQYITASSALDAMIAAFESNATDILNIYG